MADKLDAAVEPTAASLRAVDSKHRSRRVWLGLCVAFVLSAIFMAIWLDRGWLPQDDGVLAQSALRVLRGEIPHRDFVENYTGGLSYLNAVGYRLFGIDLRALRRTMFLFFLAWVPALFYVVSRFASPLVAAGITVLCVAWSVPNYPTPMPSWYNLFFAVFGAAALLRYLETGTRRWLFLAGVAGGASFAIKVIGLYYVAGALLFFVYREQQLVPTDRSEQARPAFLYRAFVITNLLAFVASVEFLILNRFQSADVIHFLIPPAALVAILIMGELRTAGRHNLQRFSTLFRMIIPFALGFSVPVAVLLLPYARSSSLGAFLRGVFVRGTTAATGLGIVAPLPAQFLWLSALLLALIAGAMLGRWLDGLVPAMLTALGLGVLLFLAGSRLDVLRWTFVSVRVITPLLVLLGALVLYRQPRFADRLSQIRRQQLLLVLAIAAICSLVQFPFAAPIYFCYCAPLVFVALTALVSIRRSPANRYILLSLLAFYALFGVLRLAPRRIYQHWLYDPSPVPSLQTFSIPRTGGIRAESVSMYEAAVAVVRQHSNGNLLLATPECPEMYFLTGLRNPTGSDSGVGPQEWIELMRRKDVTVAVINTGSTFSSQSINREVVEEVARQFPNRQKVGKYWIAWR